MLKYNDKKDRLKLEQTIDKKMMNAEKLQKAQIKHQVSKTRDALRKFEEIKQKVARDKKHEARTTLELIKDI